MIFSDAFFFLGALRVSKLSIERVATILIRLDRCPSSLGTCTTLLVLSQCGSCIFCHFFQLSNIDALLDDIEKNFPKLTYLSLLGNTACPNQLSCHDKDEEDYLRYR